MAADNQPAPTQPASPRPATTREIIQIAGGVIALVAVMSLVVSMTLAPMREYVTDARRHASVAWGKL